LIALFATKVINSLRNKFGFREESIGDVQLLVVVDEAVKLEQFPAKLTIKPTTQGMG
jgi:hypothetical protein